MADTEQRTETRSSQVPWSRLVEAVDPERSQRKEVVYQFSNGRVFVGTKGES